MELTRTMKYLLSNHFVEGTNYEKIARALGRMAFCSGGGMAAHSDSKAMREILELFPECEKRIRLKDCFYSGWSSARRDQGAARAEGVTG